MTRWKINTDAVVLYTLVYQRQVEKWLLADHYTLYWRRHTDMGGWVPHSRFRPARQVWKNNVCIGWWWYEDGAPSRDRVLKDSYEGRYRFGVNYSGPYVIRPGLVIYDFNGKEVDFEEVRDLLGWPHHWTESSPEVRRRFTPEEEMIIRLTFEGQDGLSQ